MEPDVRVTGQRPAGWVDKTMLVYAAPAEPGRAVAPNIVVARDALGRDETFREYCNRQIEGFRSTLPHFHREDEGTGRIRGADAFQIRFRWRSGGGELGQHVYFISAGSGVVVTYTATAAADDFAAHRDVFDQGLADLVIAPAGQD